MIRFAAGAATDVGRVRKVNEDRFLVTDSFFAVADGMGGHRGGEVASAGALAALEPLVDRPEPAALVDAVRAANSAVFQQAALDPDLHGMGTTLSGIGLVLDTNGASLGVVNVGDSRVYRLDPSGVRLDQLTLDHSWVETMVRDGQLSPEEAASHPKRNVLTRALGIEGEVAVDLFLVEIRAGDRFLICSDGLYNELHHDQITAVLRRFADPAEAASELVRRATDAGGRDNVTVVVVDVLEADGAAASVPLSPAPASQPASAPAAPPQPRAPRLRITWRMVAFLTALALVAATAVGAVAYYSQSAYFVKLTRTEPTEVVLYRGRPGGVLWFSPTVAERTGIDGADVPERYLDQLMAGHVLDSRAAADAYLARLRAAIAQEDEQSSSDSTSDSTDGSNTDSTGGPTTDSTTTEPVATIEPNPSTTQGP